jgi:hypothetical protein
MPRTKVIAETETEVTGYVSTNPHTNVCSGTVYSDGVQEQLDRACVTHGFTDNRWVSGTKAHFDKEGNWVPCSGAVTKFGTKEYNRWATTEEKSLNSRRFYMPTSKYQCPEKYQSSLTPDAIPIVVSVYIPTIDKKTGKRKLIPSSFTVFNIKQTIGVIGKEAGQLPK